MRISIVLLCYLAHHAVVAFVAPLRLMRTTNSGSLSSAFLHKRQSEEAEWSEAIFLSSGHNRLVIAAAGLLSGVASIVPSALADTEVELADLPPTYVPVLFGLGLVVVSTANMRIHHYFSYFARRLF